MQQPHKTKICLDRQAFKDLLKAILDLHFVQVGSRIFRQVRGVGVENLGRLELEERDKYLRHACRAGVDFSIIRSLYENKRLSGLTLRHTTVEDGMRFAARGGHLEIIKALIETLGIYVDAVDGNGLTALMWAAWNGHTDIVEKLLAANADVNQTDNNDNTPLVIVGGPGSGKSALVANWQKLQQWRYAGMVY